MTDNSQSMFTPSLVYNAWKNFRKGKKPSQAIIYFEYDLEKNLSNLHNDLRQQNYRHGKYIYREVNDNKRRLISVAPVRDRIVHRLIYDQLMPKVDIRLDYDVWSCRPNKGLHQAVDRTKTLLNRHKDSYVWRMDIRKFFDSVIKSKLLNMIHKYDVSDELLELCENIIHSYRPSLGQGMPIGNLTSQIFANIYLNEWDRFVRHQLQPLAYLRYGDDCILFFDTSKRALNSRSVAEKVLHEQLGLSLNFSNNIIIHSSKGLRFLGLTIYGSGTKINNKTWSKIHCNLDNTNLNSYFGIIAKFASTKQKNSFQALLRCNIINREN